MAEWWSIEVLHGEFSAFRWQEQHDSALIEAALTNGADDGSWHADRWGVVFETTGPQIRAACRRSPCGSHWLSTQRSLSSKIDRDGEKISCSEH
jgi:hypothetical protein